jgi:hypothetical protein
MTNDKARMTKECPNNECFFRLFVIFPLVVLLCGCVGPHEHHPHLVGRVSGNSYMSPQGHFSVPYPVSPEVGGRIIRDDAQSVTFHDNWGSKIGFYSKSFNAQSPMMSALQTQGREKALDTLAMDIYGSSIAPHYHTDVRDGAISFIYLKPVGPKTGVAAFIYQTRVYLVETDLLPAVQLLSKDDEESQKTRDIWLENRALELLQTIEIK